MTQKGWDIMTGPEKGTLLIGDDVIVCPHNDPDNAVDYCGFTGTITFDQYVDIVNNCTIDLYFRIEASIISGNENEWGGCTVNVGLVSASSKTAYDWQPSRTVPTSKVTETMRAVIKAYTDAGYTSQYGEDNCDYSFQFFSHIDTLATIVYFGDFEGTMDGWSETSYYANPALWPYTGAAALTLAGASDNETTDASGQTIPTKTEYISQTFNLSGYSYAYIVIHPTYLRQASGTAEAVLRVWTATKDYIIRIPMTVNTYEPHRIALPLPCVNGYVRIAGLYKSNYDLTLDTILIVGFA